MLFPLDCQSRRLRFFKDMAAGKTSPCHSHRKYLSNVSKQSVSTELSLQMKCRPGPSQCTNFIARDGSWSDVDPRGGHIDSSATYPLDSTAIMQV